MLPKNVEIFYADESGFEEHCSRIYGYSQKGKRVYGKVPGTRHGRLSVVGAASRESGFVAGFSFKGCMNGALFLGWLEQIFVPALKNPKNSVLVLDNARFHPKEEIRQTAGMHGFSVIFLPPYSPDLNKIEKFWANIKNWLRLHIEEFDSFWDGFCHAFNRR